MPVFEQIPLGRPIPDTPHAVSCSLPTMRAVIGYEEKDPAVMAQLATGYPRFVVHPFVRRLGEHLLALAGVRDRTVWLTASSRMADLLLAHLGPGVGERFCREGIHGVLHPAHPELFRTAKVFLQNRGGALSSRAAEEQLVRLGLEPALFPEETFAGDAEACVRRCLRRALPAAADRDLLLTSCGMNAIWSAFTAVAALQRARGRTVWLQMGWLYLDTIALLKTLTDSPADYVYLRDVGDLDAVRRIFAAHGARIAGVVAEVPTNPLIQTPDLPALAALCREQGARLLVDPSIASVFCVDVLPHADVVVTSLTKYTASGGDLTAGLCAVNPAGPDADALRGAIAAKAEPLHARDLARLAHETLETESVLAAIHERTAAVVRFLENHPAIRRVHWALQDGSADNYRRIARAPDVTGGMITFSLRNPGRLDWFYDTLRLPKGPSFGMKTTLICPFMYLAHYDLVTSPAGLAELAASRLDPELLRLCVGTEPLEAIVEALAEALAA